MTISSSLNAGVAGLAANASRLATIADNIANSATYGYKRVESDFSSLVIESGEGTYSAGGVRASTQRLIDQPGALASTNNATDLAVRGRGFLPVTTSSSVAAQTGDYPLFLATTGSFRTDADGYLRTTSGITLMGWPAAADGTIPTYPRDTGAGLEPVQINVNQFTSEPTTRISMGVNLPATDTEFGASGGPLDLSIEYFDNLGTSQSIAIQFTPTVPAAPGASNTWTMVLRDSASGGAVIGEYDVLFDDTRGSGGTISSVTTVSGGGYNAATGEFTVNVAGGPIDINIGAVGTGTGLTQLSDSFAPTSISKDGSPVGNLISVEVDENGFVRASFDIGITRTIYQIPLIDLPNPNGLIANDNQTYSTSNESGTFFLWDAADGPTGDVVGYALEESATDVAGELTQLIQTQRAYSSNAKVIQTVELSLAVAIFLPVAIWFWVSTRFELIERRFCSATIALVLVRILAMCRSPGSGAVFRPGFGTVIQTDWPF
ncbi:MAG: flagellar hook-basal body complex protein [Silicimonas sp.]|nr:flagellar hook-basal body complex protein [Silicimonas sp.]NND17133.1 flagellar hook-basal body complex protein [Silicimonas sp.]NND22962.1 flagellar hook-basal body complex protein [Silicimonas sp.]RZW08528.1 MAG: flagellar hook-basal body complex protein [Paracoccaceae bacterium]